MQLKRVYVLAAFAALVITIAMQRISILRANASDNPRDDWLTIEDCPVLLEKAIEVPASESGVLESIGVELNAVVAAGQLLTRLDTSLAKMESKVAQLQCASAIALANDSSNVKYHELALKEAEEELANYKSLGKSASSPTELRRMTLAVAKAELAVQRCQQEKQQAALDVQLKKAALEAAELRLARRQILAPAGGVVTTIYRQTGEWVEAGQPVFKISDLEHLQVDCLVRVDQIALGRVKETAVRVEANPTSGVAARLAGKITSYDPEVSSQGFVRIHTRVQNVQQNGNWQLLPGMTVRVQIARGASLASLKPRVAR